MEPYSGKTLSWSQTAGAIELRLHHEPCNEIGSATLGDLERFGEALDRTEVSARALVIYSEQPQGFCAGADLRELYRGMQPLETPARQDRVRDFLLGIHRVFNQIDAAPLVTVAAVHGVVFGGGFELALTCDMIVADRTARFCFPELRLGLIPGFGGIPRLKRDLGNGLVRDLLLTGRRLNAQRAHAPGLVSQVAGEGEALRLARHTAAQVRKFDRGTSAVAKSFIKPLPAEELQREIELFCELFTQPAVEAGLKQFVESTDAQPYLP